MTKVFDREVKELLTQAVLIRRGRSLPAIVKLLGQPDDLQRNPFQSTSVPNVRLYREERVLAAEQGEGWKKREAPSKTCLKQFEAVALPEGLEHAMEGNGWKLVGFKQVDLTPDGSFNGPGGIAEHLHVEEGRPHDRSESRSERPPIQQRFRRVCEGECRFPRRCRHLRGYKALHDPTGQDRRRTVYSEPDGGEVTWQ
jgi:hypothetical protein